MIVLLAGIQSVPKEYYEAAVIDGAGPFRKFLNVTFPLIMPSFNNLMVVTLIGSLKVFDIVMVTTRGGPGGASEVLNTIVFKNFGLGLQGLANAQTIILSAMVIAVSFSAYLIGRRKEVDL